MKKSNYLLAIVSIITISACNVNPSFQQVKFSGEAQGTYYAVTYFENQGTNYQNEIEELLKKFDQSVSLWVSNSVLSKVNNNDTDVLSDDIFINTFNLSKEIYRQTNGAFDPTVGPLANAWGFGFTDRMKIDHQVIDSLLMFVGFDKVKIEKNKVIKEDRRIQLNFNGIAQGYSVDLTGSFLESKGVENFLIDIGGEVLAKGIKPNGENWKVGIEKPSDNAGYGQELKAIVKMENKSMATSGSYRKFYEEGGIRYSHTIDPTSGYPVRHSLLSVSVLANNCAIADGFATGFMVIGLEGAKDMLKGNKEIEAYFIYSDENGNLKTWFTKGFEKVLLEELK